MSAPHVIGNLNVCWGAHSLHRIVGLRPCDCESIADICSLDASHKRVGKYDMLIQHDQAVILTEQPSGEKCRAQIVIPKRIFRQLLEWYETEQPNAPHEPRGAKA